MPSGRTSRIEDADFAKAVALAYVEGLTRQEMCDEFGVRDPDTITKWCRDPRVKAHAAKFAQERILRIVSRTDTEIERRLSSIDEEEIETILKIRKEYLNNAVRIEVGGGEANSDTINDTLEEMENNPELMADLAKLLERKEK